MAEMSPTGFVFHVTIESRFFDGTPNPTALQQRLMNWCDFLVIAGTSEPKQAIIHEEDITRLREVVQRGKFVFNAPRSITIWKTEEFNETEFRRLSEGICQIQQV